MTRLRQRMIEDMEIRNLSPNTQLSYLQQVSGFAKYCHRSPEEVGPDDIRAYQVHLTTERKLAPGRSASSPRRYASYTRSPSSATGSTWKSRYPRNRTSCR